MDIKNTLEITDLTVAYDNKPVLWDIDLSIPEGVLMAIVGPNGAGKTTLIKAIQGLVPTQLPVGFLFLGNITLRTGVWWVTSPKGEA